MKKARGRLLLTLVSIAIAILSAEALFRVRLAVEDAPGSDDDWRARYRRMNETIYRRSEDPELVYEPVPSSSVEMEYGVAGFNSAGMRDDREHPRESDRRRLALVGDSLVWSEFLALHDTLGPRTEEALGDGWDVLNFGATGYDTAQEARWYRRAVRPFAPDAVVVVWCMNDVMIMSGPFERYANPADRARKDAQEAHIERAAAVRRETIDGVLEQREREAPIKVLARALGLVERWRFDAAYTDEYLVMFREEDRRARVRQALTELGRDISADGAEPLLLISPVLESWDDYHWGVIHAWVRERAEAAGFTVIDPLERWRGAHDPEELRISGDNLHYDGSGTRVLGRTIADAVREATRE